MNDQTFESIFAQNPQNLDDLVSALDLVLLRLTGFHRASDMRRNIP
jgi:hypothetical protein